jgi:hypothetical protein
MLTRKDISRIPGVTPKTAASGGRGPGLRGLKAPKAVEADKAPTDKAPAPPLRKGMTAKLRGMT